MNSIMGPIGPEQLELFALELGEIATFDFLYARRRRDVLWDHPWRAGGRPGGVQFFVRSISPKLL